MKKIVSLVLAMVMSIACINCVYSEEKVLNREDIPIMLEEDATAIGLNKLGILFGTGDGLQLDREVTRAEAVALIFRMHYENTGVMGLPSPEFSDLDGHWAYKEVTAAKKMGIVHGVGNGNFEPDRTVTGKEFAVMLLSMLGYDDVNLDNAYDIGKSCELLSDNFTKSVVYNNYTLLRGDCARIMWSTFLAKQASGGLYYKKLIEVGKFAEEDFYGSLVMITPLPEKVGFADRLNDYMPKDKNYMFSPFSIRMALGLAANGASNETREEILKTLDISDLDVFNQNSKETIERYSQTDILCLNIANSIWINKDKTQQRFSDEFKGISETFYNADVGIVDNMNAVKEINSWVNDKTNEKIPQILDNSSDFWAMLINAIYFKGTWQNEFGKYATKPDEFTNADGTKKTIDFMNKSEWLHYADVDGIRIVKLPYINRTDKFSEDGEYIDTEIFDDLNVSMYLIDAQQDMDVIAELEEALNKNLFNRTYVGLSMPKFKIEYESELKDILNAMGINTIFDASKSDLSKMFDTENMFCTSVLHKTYIEVDEQGTEAAAVTAIASKGAGMPVEVTEVKFNKPFYFIIRDNMSGDILFMGRFAFAS